MTPRTPQGLSCGPPTPDLPGQDQVPFQKRTVASTLPTAGRQSPSTSSGPTHFFSFSPTAGDAAGLLSFSLGGDGE